jgi:predicted methyltransferase
VKHLCHIAVLGAALVATFGAGARAAESRSATIAAAIADPGRPPADMLRDPNNNPSQTIAFSNAKSRDVVVDFIPHDGYYTRIFSALVGSKGIVHPLVPDMFGKENADAWKDGTATILAIENIHRYRNVTMLGESLLQYGGQFSLPEQADVVWTADGYHELHGKPFGAAALVVPVLKQVLASLKPGGNFIVIDNRAAKGAMFSQAETLRRSDEDAVKAEILSAGFTFDGASDALANPGDDHTKPATDASLAGKPDRFVLRFKKPLSARGTDLRPKDVGGFAGYYGNTEHTDHYSNDPKIERWVIYHPDGAYEEYGNTGTRVQAGTFYWDAAGHNCQLHEFPAEQRDHIVCHSDPLGKKAGDEWIQNNGGTATTGDIRYRLEKGNATPLERIVAP